jgi:hypothetical protein
MCLGCQIQTVGWADDRSPTISLESRNGGTRSSAHPTLWLKSGVILNTFLSGSVNNSVPGTTEIVAGIEIGKWF